MSVHLPGDTCMNLPYLWWIRLCTLLFHLLFQLLFFSHIFFSLLKCVSVCIFKCIFVFPLQSMFRKRWKKLFLSEGSVMLLQVKVMLEYNVLNSMFSLFSVSEHVQQQLSLICNLPLALIFTPVTNLLL